MSTIIPAGKTFRLTVKNTTSTATIVTSDVPCNALQFMNDGANPVLVKFFLADTNPASTSTNITWPTTSTAVYDTVIQHGVDNQIVELPVRLASGVSALGGFTSTIVISTIAETGTPGLYITPVQVPNRGR